MVKLLLQQYARLIVAFGGGNGIRHKNEAYAKSLANSNALKKAAAETAKGQARKLVNQVAKNTSKAVKCILPGNHPNVKKVASQFLKKRA